MTADKLRSFAVALAAVAGAIAALAVFAHDYPLTPATVPTHFGVSGAADAYGPRSTFILFPALSLMFAAIAVAVWAFVPPPPNLAQPLASILPLMVVLIFAETTWMLFFVEMGSFAVALGRAGGLGSGAFVGIAIVLATTFVMLAFAVFAVRRPN